MFKICFISFYDIKEYILSLKIAFESQLYTVENYPLFRFAFDSNDKIEDYPVHMIKYMQRVEADVIFWIFMDVPIDVFRLVRSSLPNAKLVMYLADATPVDDVFLAKLKHFDYVVTHQLDSVENICQYSDMSPDQILYLPPCYDNLLFKPVASPPDKYVSDLVYLNYQYNDRIEQLIRQLVDFSQERNLILKLYGTTQFKIHFPDHYVANYSYLDMPLIYAEIGRASCRERV